MVLGGIRKQAEHFIRSKPVGSAPPWLLLHFHVQFPSWLPSVREWKLNLK